MGLLKINNEFYYVSNFYIMICGRINRIHVNQNVIAYANAFMIFEFVFLLVLCYSTHCLNIKFLLFFFVFLSFCVVLPRTMLCIFPFLSRHFSLSIFPEIYWWFFRLAFHSKNIFLREDLVSFSLSRGTICNSFFNCHFVLYFERF